ncbi:MAG: threonine dehydrogenase [Candidatus Xenobia bacterium]
MKALAVRPSAHQVELIELPEPRLETPTQVKLRILEVGICGTDREICEFHYGTPPPGEEYLVIGHESLARVLEVGSQVTSLRLGDLVVPTVRRPCQRSECPACQVGRQDFCFTGEFSERGIKGLHGFNTELVVEDERYLIRVPEALRPWGVLVEPLTIAEKALLQVHDVQERLPWQTSDRPLRALVLGAGPVGLLGAMLFQARGFATTVYSRDPAGSPRARLVESLGATYHPGPLADIKEVDFIYEAVGASELAFAAIELLGPNGIFCFTGVPGRKGAINLESGDLMRRLVLKNQVVFGTVNSGRDGFENAVRDLAEFRRLFPEALDSLITGRFPVADYRQVLLNGKGGIKNVFRWT